MNLINTVFNNWSKYELNMELLLIISILIVSLIAVYLFTKSKKFLLLCLLSLLLLLFFNTTGLFLANLILQVEISEVFRIVPILSMLLLLSNLGPLIGFYTSKIKAKSFNIASVRKEYLSDSKKQTLFLVLLGICTLLFLSPKTEVVVTVSLLSTISTIWFTYWISKYILK